MTKKRKLFDVTALVRTGPSRVPAEGPSERGLTNLPDLGSMTGQQRDTFNEGRTQALAMQIEAAEGEYATEAVTALRVQKNTLMREAAGGMIDAMEVASSPLERRVARDSTLNDLQRLERDQNRLLDAVTDSMEEMVRKPVYTKPKRKTFWERFFGIE